MEKNIYIKMMIVIAIISFSAFTGCTTSDLPAVEVATSKFPSAVRTEEGLARAMQGDYSDVFSPFGGNPNFELAQKNIQYSGLGISDYYYHPKQHPEKAELGAIYLYEEWITYGYTSTDPENPTPPTGENFNITWYPDTNSALTQFESWRKVLDKLVESDEKSGYFYSYSETPCSKTGVLKKIYTILWMQEGNCFMAHIPARYGLKHILELCDMEAVDNKAQG
jgi:hypothetical protein